MRELLQRLLQNVLQTTHAHVCAQEQVRELLQGVLQSVRAWQAALSVVGEAELTALAAEAEPPRPHPAGI